MNNRSTRQTASQLALLLLRLVFGSTFLIHGIIKFTHMANAISTFTKLGVPLPALAAPAIATLEVLGGLALILGLGASTRIFAFLLAINMVFAILLAKLDKGFVGGYEFELALLAGLLVIALTGPGRLSLVREKER